jgi:hypothetical protein
MREVGAHYDEGNKQNLAVATFRRNPIALGLLLPMAAFRSRRRAELAVSRPVCQVPNVGRDPASDQRDLLKSGRPEAGHRVP